MSSVFKVLHVSYSKKVPSGVIHQLKSEIKSVQKFDLNWTTILFTSSNERTKFIRNLNSKFSAPLQWLMVYAWIYQHRKEFDVILLRNIKSDVVGWLFLPFINNLITIHHTKEIEECKLASPAWYGIILSLIEKHFGKMKLRNVKGIAGVTNEIVCYEKKRIKRDKLTLVIPNGIDTEKYNLVDGRKKDIKQALFVASKFEPWHGLEKLLCSLKCEKYSDLVLHIVGKLNPVQQGLINEIGNKNNIICHGYLNNDAIINLMSEVDVGLSSFSMELNSLTEASTLKVREYLNNGLPVYSGHKDSGLPKNFLYYRIGEPKVHEILNFIDKMKKVSKRDIREESIKYIDKGAILLNTYNELERVLN